MGSVRIGRAFFLIAAIAGVVILLSSKSSSSDGEDHEPHDASREVLAAMVDGDTEGLASLVAPDQRHLVAGAEELEFFVAVVGHSDLGECKMNLMETSATFPVELSFGPEAMESPVICFVMTRIDGQWHFDFGGTVRREHKTNGLTVFSLRRIGV